MLPPPLRYAVIGDSYSIGEGASEEESWPLLLAARLTNAGIPMELVSNPARTGWTTRDAIEKELPLFRAARPDFGTFLLGVNDWVQGVEPVIFRANVAELLDAMLELLPNEQRLLIVNIPDFSVTPKGPTYAQGRDIPGGLAHFNGLIAQEAAQRGLRLVDIFPLSKRMGDDPALVAADGLHPSAKAYAAWAELIFPAARDSLG
jgi:lysophospholipase L1-like esterase